MKIFLIILGTLSALFSIAQILQLLGLIGIGPSIAGAAFVAGGAAVSLACFQKAFKPNRSRRPSSKL